MKLEEICGESDCMRRFTSSCSHVTGTICVGPDECGCAIYEWQSDKPGYTVVALEELKTTFGAISVVGIGSDEGDPSWRYWLRMAAKGLVDRLESDDGENIQLPASFAGCQP